MGGSLLVPWRIRDSFFVLLWSTLASIGIFVLWGMILGFEVGLQGVTSAELEESFKTFYSSSPWLDIFLVLQSLLVLRFVWTLLLKPWSVQFKDFIVPGQAASDARAAIKMFFGCLVASLSIMIGILAFIVAINLVMGRDPTRWIQAYHQGIQRESRSLIGANVGIIRIVPLIFLGPPIEELLYRGCLYGALRKRFLPWQANGLSSCVFALSHGYLFGFPNVLMLGILAAWAYQKTGSLRTPVLFHMFWNAFCLSFVKPVLWIPLIGAITVLTLWTRKAAPC